MEQKNDIKHSDRLPEKQMLI